MSHIEEPPESTITTIAPNGNHVGIEIWPSREWSEWLYDFANIALIVALVVGVFATVMIVWMGNKKEEYLKKDVAAAQLRGDEAIAKSERDRLERVKIEQEMLKQLRPRDLSKQQFDDLVSALKGKINKKLSVHTLTDREASAFGFVIMDALTKAGIEFDWVRPTTEKDVFPVPDNSTGLTLYVSDVRNDPEAKQLVEMFMDAFAKAGVPMGAHLPDESFPDIPSPSLFISKRQPPFSWFPEYLAPAGLPKPPWEPK
jgi:hypothetical protein